MTRTEVQISVFEGIAKSTMCRNRGVEINLKSAFALVLPCGYSSRMNLTTATKAFYRTSPDAMTPSNGHTGTLKTAGTYSTSVLYLMSPTIPDTLRRLANMGFTNLGRCEDQASSEGHTSRGAAIVSVT